MQKLYHGKMAKSLIETKPLTGGGGGLIIILEEAYEKDFCYTGFDFYFCHVRQWGCE
jgi:hypothetical protein